MDLSNLNHLSLETGVSNTVRTTLYNSDSEKCNDLKCVQKPT